MAFYNLFFNEKIKILLLALGTNFEILGSVVERAQRMSCLTSRRLRCLDFIHTGVENADSHSHVELKANNFFRAILLISGYDDATLSQNSVTSKFRTDLGSWSRFSSQSIGLAIHLSHF